MKMIRSPNIQPVALRNSVLEPMRAKILGGGTALNTEASSLHSSLIPDEFIPEKTRALRKMASAKKILTLLAAQYADSWTNALRTSGQDFFEKEHLMSSSLVHLIAVTDGYEDSVGHSQLVAQYAVVLAKAMGLVERNGIVDIRHGALLHDIGKIGIPERILRKPASLTPAEMEVVQRHPLIGYEIIHDCEFLSRAARIVLFHHERYDGTGYPYGLTGEEIPIEARIFAVADTLDAITSDRPYRRGMSLETALIEIDKQRGTQFDPEVVKAFLAVPDATWLQIKENNPPLRSWAIH